MPTFGHGCAVFLQSDIVNFQRQGWKPEQILAGLARGDESAVPDGKYYAIPAQVVRKDNVDAVWTERWDQCRVAESRLWCG